MPLPAATNTIADGLRTNQPGKLTWPIASKLVEQVFTVTEEEIKQGMRLVWERMKLVIEPSAGVGCVALCARIGLARVSPPSVVVWLWR